MENEINSEETLNLVYRFEQTITQQNSDLIYFDADEIEHIIDYYSFNYDNEKAHLAWQYAMKLYPNSKTIRIKQSKIFYIEGEFLNTIKCLKAEDNVEGDYLGIWAESLLHLGEEGAANEKFRKYLYSCDIDELPSIYLDIINLFLVELRFESTLFWLEEAYLLFPNNADILSEYGYYYDQIMEWEKSIKMYNESIDINPYKADTWGLLGTVYFKIQSMEKALDAFNFCLVLAPENYQTILQKAHCLFNLNRFEEAKIEYKSYIEINDKDPITWCFYAECFENTEEYEYAIDCYKKALELDENYVDGLVGISACYNEMGNDYNSEAFHYAQKAYLIQDNNLEAIILIGNMHFKMAYVNDSSDDYQTALAFFLKALEIDNEDANVNLNVGNIYIQHSMFAEALPYYEKAYFLDNSIDKILIFLSICYYGINDKKKWEYYFTLAKETYPNAEEIFYGIFPEAQ